ncbi:MAG: DNA gyrase subunit A [Candidatus Micrarchaeia archaeon]
MAEIIKFPLEKEMQSDYIDYAMSVIISRALPDARDGLKPAQRRILYAMYVLRNTHDQPTKKSARIVGDVIGKYHPHGDEAVYEALARMAQDFTMNYPLVQGQGNMGSIDGDPPAAQRYTEVRLSRIAEEMLKDLDKEAVSMVPNFDGTEIEPVVLPSKIPNLFLNGASGIAVAFTTSIMPHNLGELCDAIVAYIDKPDITSEQLINYVKAPEFPTGGVVFYNESLKQSYITGKGSVTIRGVSRIEENKNRHTIIITEIPYTVNKASLVEQIAKLVKDKVLTEIVGLKDESSKAGIRITIELKKEANIDYVMNMLYKHTQLEITLPIANVAVINNRLVTLNLQQYIKIFVEHRISVIRNRTIYDLRIASDRLHIIEGLIKALYNIDSVVNIIKSASDIKDAKAKLIAAYELSEKQATAILDMKLSKLTHLETSALEQEKAMLVSDINNYNEILSSNLKILEIIKKESEELKAMYSTERKTKIEAWEEYKEIDREDLINDEDVTITLTRNGYLKRMNTNVYKRQARGGKGVIAMQFKEGDSAKEIIYCRSKDFLLMFTNTGRLYWLKAYKVPEESRYSVGKSAVNLIKLGENEQIEKIISIRDFSGKYITLVTRKGIIKRMPASFFSKPRGAGIRAISINEEDSFADAAISDGSSQIFIATALGKAIRFDEHNIRSMGRSAAGVRGIRLSKEDEVVNLIMVKQDSLIATISEKGYGKVTEASAYRLQHRGGSGVINMKVNDKTGRVVKVLEIRGDSNLLLLSSVGSSIMINAGSVRKTGRSASGVRLMNISGDAKVIDAQEVSQQG